MSERIVQETLDSAITGRTTIAIAHRLSTVVKADVIFVIRKGKIVEQGNHKKLMAKKGFYYKLVSEQTKVNK